METLHRHDETTPLNRLLAAAGGQIMFFVGDRSDKPEPDTVRPRAVPYRPARLSAAERRVAVLAVAGHSNRQIATALYLTVSTVEQHLTRVYRKLRVTGRADLPAHLPV
jgi:DNA-binding CsgD family transcriptional regulator